MADDKSLFDILPKIATKSDIGAAGIGLAIGYLLDSAFHPFGMPPREASMYAGAGAIGIKNAIQAWWESRSRKAETASSTEADEKTRLSNVYANFRSDIALAKALAKISRDAGIKAIVEIAEQSLKRLQVESDLWELGLSSDRQFLSALKWFVETSNIVAVRDRIRFMEAGRQRKQPDLPMTGEGGQS